MAYEIVMPQLSDSMSEGKLISWKVNVGDSVKSGDVIAEVESDKAIMEVQTFKDGVVKELKIKAGESAKVGSIIAIIEDSSSPIKAKEEPKPKEDNKQEIKEDIKIKEPKEAKYLEDEIKININAVASAKAKVLAKRYAIDINRLQKEGRLPKPAHTKDIKEYIYRRYFTPKALKLIKEYNLEPDIFKLNHKYSYKEIKEYIKDKNIPLIKPISSIQRAIIDTVTKAKDKPTYHIYDYIDVTLLKRYSSNKKSMTVWLLKIFAKAMTEVEEFRSQLTKEGIKIYPNASISLAIANKSSLYMVVFKDINLKSSNEIALELEQMKQKVKENRLKPEDLKGSTFGISNLGMVGIDRFDAMINGDDSGIVAVGAQKDGKIAVTLTLDHRLINGWQGAIFMQRVKELALDEDIFKG